MNVEELASAIRQRRRALGLQQVDLAELASVAVHTVSNLESGKGNPTLDVVGKVLGALGLELRVVPRSAP